MAMEIGDSFKGTGLAGAIASKMKDTFGDDFKLDGTVETHQTRLMFNAIAAGIVTYLKDHAEIEVDVQAVVRSGIALSVDRNTHIGTTTGIGEAVQANAPGRIK